MGGLAGRPAMRELCIGSVLMSDSAIESTLPLLRFEGLHGPFTRS